MSYPKVYHDNKSDLKTTTTYMVDRKQSFAGNPPHKNDKVNISSKNPDEIQIAYKLAFSIPQNSVVLIVSATNSGKTTLALYFIHYWMTTIGTNVKRVLVVCPTAAD